MRGLRGAIVCIVILGVGCQQDPREVRVTLALPQALGCRPTEVDDIVVRALGDFPAREPNVVMFDPASGPETVDRFPEGTQVVSIEARGSIGADPWTGGGVAQIGESSSESIVSLLRYGRACPLADASARVPAGAAVAALSDGRLWIAGGHDVDVLDDVVSVRPGDTLATHSDVRLFVDRTSATATALPGDVVVIAGGSSTVDGRGEDTLEIVSASEDARVGDGFLRTRRREHTATAIEDRAVLIAGGRESAGGAPHAEIEVLTLDDAGSEGRSVTIGRLSVPRAGHSALSLDDGRVALAGGVDASGDAISVVELFDPATRTIASVGGLPARLDAAYASLPGARVVQIGGRAEGGWSRSVEVLVGESVVSLGEVVPRLETPRAVALADGRVLVIGRDASVGRAAGVVLNAGSGEVSTIEASRVATVLVALADGSIAEGDPAGLAAIRIDLRTPFDSPPATIVPALMEDRAQLAIDAPGRWSVERGELVAAVDGARFDVPGLRFASFDLELGASGVLELLLIRGTGAPIAIALSQDAIELDGCRAPRADGSPLRISRAGDRVSMEAGAGAADCTAELPERVGLAVRARGGAGVRSLSIARR